MDSSASRRYVTGALIGCALVLCVHGRAGAQQHEVVQSGKPFSAFSASALLLRDSVVALAKSQVGKRYVRGGASPERGFDCSGLVRYVLGGFRVDMPRTARQQATAGLAVVRDTTHLRPGDLLTFGKGTRGISHIGIYVGHGRYVHASSGSGRVIESDLSRSSSSLVRAWRGVRRIVLGADSTGTSANTDG